LFGGTECKVPHYTNTASPSHQLPYGYRYERPGQHDRERPLQGERSRGRNQLLDRSTTPRARRGASRDVSLSGSFDDGRSPLGARNRESSLQWGSSGHSDDGGGDEAASLADTELHRVVKEGDTKHGTVEYALCALEKCLDHKVLACQEYPEPVLKAHYQVALCCVVAQE
jgi:hypothetical protein